MLSKFGHPAARSDFPSCVRSDFEQTPAQLHLLATKSIHRFSSEQHNVFNEDVHSVLPEFSAADLDRDPGAMLSETQRLFFLDAQEGTGKTIVKIAIQRFLKSREKRILEGASFAVVAQLLENQRTAHSALKTSIPVYSESICNINASS